MSETNYHQTRFTYDKKRQILWRTLIDHYFCKFSSKDTTVLEIGAGYCDFINNIPAKKKYAFDIWDGIRDHANRDVETIVGGLHDLDRIPDDSVGLLFASNVFEHIEQAALGEMLGQLRRKLTPEGRLVIIQPNFKYAFRDYFDDYTHCSIWTDVSLADFLRANQWDVEQVSPKFMPLSIKSKLPTWPLLIRLYLLLPYKPMGKQMLLVARKS